MGARDYINHRANKVNQGKTDTLNAVEGLHTIQREILELRQKAQVEQLREVDTALATAMDENHSMLTGLAGGFVSVVSAVESLPASFKAVDAAEARIEAAMPSTEPPST